MIPTRIAISGAVHVERSHLGEAYGGKGRLEINSLVLRSASGKDGTKIGIEVE